MQDGVVDRIFLVATPQEVEGFQHLFLINTLRFDIFFFYVLLEISHDLEITSFANSPLQRICPTK